MSLLHELPQRFQSAWNRSDSLFDILKPEAFSAQPIEWRHPFIFYLGHLPAFAWNQIGRNLLSRPSLHPVFDEIFSRGIDPDIDTGTCHRHPKKPESWPKIPEIEA